MKSINAAISAKEAAVPHIGLGKLPFANFLPAILPLVGAFLVLAARIKLGASAVPADFTMVVLALLCYMTAAASLITNFWAPVRFLQRLGLATASLGFFFNFSSWLIRWVSRGEAENWKRMTDQITGEYHSMWFFSYIPFANLYDLSVAFAFGAAFATLLVSNRENTRFVGGLSFPLITLVLLMAIFIGNTFQPLMPVLDSYWRPIHVGVASMSYGVALVSFALAVVYLIKDGVKSEAMGIAVTAFFVVGYFVVWLMGGIKAFDPFSAQYRLNPVLAGPEGVTAIEGGRIPLPGVGVFHTLSLLTLIGMAVCFLVYFLKNNEGARRVGHLLLRASLTFQVATIALLFYQIKMMTKVGSLIGSDQFYQIGFHLLGKNNAGEWNAAGQPVANIVNVGSNFMATSGDALVLNIRSNPVEMASLFAILVATSFVAMIGFRSEKLRANLPALEKIDSLIYKTVGVAFAGLAILLVTGAVWANESWGKYWGWDSKETGALVAWLSYAGYLHTRIAHGWSGRRSAYFAVLGFLLVIFTYLGVSYILPGLHSYA
ncbi:MAG TPA: cytochrome c biogenesis protein CcsA [Blastocatellia bacterium]|jgi:ABC-type transport system involved in cytochrome c biogenesis permease subunit|nr:cytochrome c biogenesis protein CcsA [Blastocatellia bacterium]